MSRAGGDRGVPGAVATRRAVRVVLLTCALGAIAAPGAGEEVPAGSPEAEREPDLPAGREAPAGDPPPPETGPEPAPLSIGPDVVRREGPWRPPLHAPGESDWLRLTSGEWLRGTIEAIGEDTVYFDSDELDDLEIDWEDVSSLRSPKKNTYRFAGRIIVTGTAGMREGVIRIDTGSGIREFPAGALFGMIEGDLREINYWSLDLGLGLTVRSGNSDQRDLSGHLEVKRETPLTETLLSYRTAYSVVEDEEVTNNQRLAGHFAWYFSKRFFVLVPVVEAFRDRFQNIDLRTTAGSGLGYQILDRRRAEWDAVIGAAWQQTRFDTTLPGDEGVANDAAVSFASTLELDPDPDVEWDTTYRLNLVVTDLDKTNHHLDSVLSVDLFGPVDLDVTFVWERIESPQPDDTGVVPESDDFRTTVGLAIDL